MSHPEADRPSCPDCALALRIVVVGIVTSEPEVTRINDTVTLALHVGPTATGMSGLLEVGLNCRCGWEGPWTDIQDLFELCEDWGLVTAVPVDTHALAVGL